MEKKMAEIEKRINNKNSFVYRSNGYYLGFIKDGFLFDPNGIYLGWLEGKFVWDKRGFFRGVLTSIEDKNYILLEKFSILPTPRSPKTANNVAPLDPPPNIRPINLPVDIVDGFEEELK